MQSIRMLLVIFLCSHSTAHLYISVKVLIPERAAVLAEEQQPKPGGGLGRPITLISGAFFSRSFCRIQKPFESCLGDSNRSKRDAERPETKTKAPVATAANNFILKYEPKVASFRNSARLSRQKRVKFGPTGNRKASL